MSIGKILIKSKPKTGLKILTGFPQRRWIWRKRNSSDLFFLIFNLYNIFEFNFIIIVLVPSKYIVVDPLDDEDSDC
jgi:hypothetical protein